VTTDGSNEKGSGKEDRSEGSGKKGSGKEEISSEKPVFSGIPKRLCQ
jgi:hypothetical protein